LRPYSPGGWFNALAPRLALHSIILTFLRVKEPPILPPGPAGGRRAPGHRAPPATRSAPTGHGRNPHGDRGAGRRRPAPRESDPRAFPATPPAPDGPHTNRGREAPEALDEGPCTHVRRQAAWGRTSHSVSTAGRLRGNPPRRDVAPNVASPPPRRPSRAPAPSGEGLPSWPRPHGRATDGAPGRATVGEDGASPAPSPRGERGPPPARAPRGLCWGAPEEPSPDPPFLPPSTPPFAPSDPSVPGAPRSLGPRKGRRGGGRRRGLRGAGAPTVRNPGRVRPGTGIHGMTPWSGS